MPTLSIRKLADQSAPRTKLFDPINGEAILLQPGIAVEIAKKLRPIMGGLEACPRPFLGIRVEGKPPKKTTLSTGFVAKGKHEGWIEVEGERAVHRSGGPVDNPWAAGTTHSFVHCDFIVIKTVDGDLRYRVTEQPDKWPDTKDGEAGHGGDVKWFYTVKLEANDG